MKRPEWNAESGYRWVFLVKAKGKGPGFSFLDVKQTGIHFSNSISTKAIKRNRHLLNGSGVTMGDIDGDGLLDLYFARLEGSNSLYKNLGNWEFKDITYSAGVACEDQFSTGAVLADIDGDRDLDLLVTSLGGPHKYFENVGQSQFLDMSHKIGLIPNMGATTMALADVDGDADLDLYVANYKTHTVKDLHLPQEIRFDQVVSQNENGYFIKPEFKGDYSVKILDNKLLMRFEHGEPDNFYLNDGRGVFTPVSLSEKRFNQPASEQFPELQDWGLTVRFQDMDNDGDPDIYVCNDFESPDRIWINNGNGTFFAASNIAIRNSSWATMGIDFSDINRDGKIDFFILDMLSRQHDKRMTQILHTPPISRPIGQIDNRPQNSRNALFLNRGDNTYSEIAQFSGIQASDWSWSNLFVDIDLDGYEDVIISTGHYYDALDGDALNQQSNRNFYDLENWQNSLFDYPSLELPNVAFRNLGNLRFEDKSSEWGFTSVDISHGMALGDLDNDGDLDVVMNRLNDPAAIYRNDSNAPRIAVRLRGDSPNTQGIGSKVKLLGGPVDQMKEVISGGSYLSGSDPLVSFAAWDEKREFTLEVTWRSGEVSRIEGVKGNRLYEVYESFLDPNHDLDDRPINKKIKKLASIIHVQ